MVGETGDIIGRAEQWQPALLPLALVAAAFALLLARGSRAERRAAFVPLAVGAVDGRHPAGAGDPLRRQGLRPRPQPAAGAGPAPGRRRGRAQQRAGAPARRRDRRASWSPTRSASAIYASTSPELQRPDWRAVADHLGEPDGPRATVTWVLGEAPLRFYLSTGAIQLKASEGYDWLVREIAFVSMGGTPPPPRRLLGPGFRETGSEDVGPLFIRRFRVARPGAGAAAPAALRHAQTDFRNNGVLLDGVGPADVTGCLASRVTWGRGLFW